MMKPIRIQRKRTKGWTMPEGAFYVGRGSKFGNPYKVWRNDDGQWIVSNGSCHHECPDKIAAHKMAVELYRRDVSSSGPHNARLIDPTPTQSDIFKYLRGRDLVCWCKPDEPCHADVLLELANGPLQQSR